MIHLTATVMTADKPNSNHRIYPKSVLEKIVKDTQERMKEHCAFGIIGMPDSAEIQLSEISHTVTNIEMVGNDLIVTVEPFLMTPQGRLLSDMIKRGDEITIRPAGTGNLTEPDENGVQTVKDDYDLISLNVVTKSQAS